MQAQIDQYHGLRDTVPCQYLHELWARATLLEEDAITYTGADGRQPIHCLPQHPRTTQNACFLYADGLQLAVETDYPKIWKCMCF